MTSHVVCAVIMQTRFKGPGDITHSPKMTVNFKRAFI